VCSVKWSIQKRFLRNFHKEPPLRKRGHNLRYHGRWIFTKNAKNLFLAVQIEKNEINILQKEWGKGLFDF